MVKTELAYTILEAIKKAVAQAIAKHESEGRGELVKAAQSKVDEK